MKQVMLASVAALALAAGSTIAMSQTGGKGKEGAAGGAAGPAMNSPAGGAPGHIEESPAPGAPGAKRGAQGTIPEKQKSTQAPGSQAPTMSQSQGEQHKNGAATKQSQGQPDKSGTAIKQSQGEREKSTTQQTRSPAPGTKQGTSAQGTGSPGTAGTQGTAGGRPMTSSNVSLTTEQKTVIRSKVLTGSAPRVTNVNFDIKIGTVVPRTVRVAPVPVTLIEIEPSWRGYMYFVYADEIIIVEPRTLQIVAVLAV